MLDEQAAMKIIRTSETRFDVVGSDFVIVQCPDGHWHLVEVSSGAAILCDSLATAARLAAREHVNRSLAS